MSILWADVVAIAADLDDVDLAAQTDILAYVNALPYSPYGSDTAWSYRLARIYLAAHLGSGALPGASTAAGSVTSETVGPITTQYAATQSTREALEATSYGRQYLSLVRNSLARLPFAI